MRFALLFALILVGCASEDESPPDESSRQVQPLIIGYNQAQIVSSSVLTFELLGTERTVAESAEIKVEGYDGVGREVSFTYFVAETDRDGDQGNIIVRMPVNTQLWPALAPSPQSMFTGSFEVDLIDEIGVLGRGRLDGQRLEAFSEFPPAIDAFSLPAAFPGQLIEVTGKNFLRPEEGATLAVVDGAVTYSNGDTREVTSAEIELVWDDSRTRAYFPLRPDVFGVQVMNFDGSVSFLNRLSSAQEFPGNALESLVFEMQPPFIATFNPDAGSRGQLIQINGRGMVPNADSDAFFGMIFRFEGTLRYDDGESLNLEGERALERSPDRVLNDSVAEMAVWYEIVERPGQLGLYDLTGLGAKPGVFEGSITPIAFDQWGEQIGEGFVGTFEVLPTKQMVHIKYLPSFSKGLEKYGVQNVEFEIRRRILEVTNRDYAMVNVEFTEDAPTQFIDFATIEIGGPDPSGENKFGYDNTCNVVTQRCKDTDNLFLADYLGGVNRNSQDEFSTPYGGVFIESFDYFSKTLNPGVIDASEDFDRVLGPFMPALGGSPVRGTEWPNGERSAQIQEAIHMIGSVVGNTISHEIGHSLGLSFFDQDRIVPRGEFHNRTPCDGCLMDSGGDRPFVERGELNGTQPPFFNPKNQEYLLEILPLP